MKKELMYFPHLHDARNDRKVRRMRNELGIEGYGIFFMLLEKLRSEDGMCYPLEDVDLLAKEFETTEQKVLATIKGYRLFEFDDQGNFYSPKLFEYMQPMFKRREKAQKAARKRWGQSNNNELNPGPDDRKALSESSNADIEQCSSNAQALPKQCSVNAVQCKEKKRKEKKTKVNKTKVNKTQEEQRHISNTYRAETSSEGICSSGDKVFLRDVVDLPVDTEGIPGSLDEVLSYCRKHGVRQDIGKAFYTYFQRSRWKNRNGESISRWQAKFKSWLKYEKNTIWAPEGGEADARDISNIDLSGRKMSVDEFLESIGQNGGNS